MISLFFAYWLTSARRMLPITRTVIILWALYAVVIGVIGVFGVTWWTFCIATFMSWLLGWAMCMRGHKVRAMRVMDRRTRPNLGEVDATAMLRLLSAGGGPRITHQRDKFAAHSQSREPRPQADDVP